MHGVAATSADAERADPLWIDAGDGAQFVDRVGDVFAATIRIFEVTGLSTALSLMGRVECEGGEAVLGESGRVVRADLLLDAASWRGEHDRGLRFCGVEAVREVEVGGEVEGAVRDGDVLWHEGSAPSA